VDFPGYEVEGMDNIPVDSPALLVYYHGAIPIDFYYLLSKYILYKGKLIRCVGDRFLFKIPGWQIHVIKDPNS
jgi:1-acyl-sn-glycerol-3-phosphate acyltransferase